jgi:poly(3-hydroxyalkanoate) synthetase
LGRKVSLASIRVPVFILAGADDGVIAPAQLLSVRHLIATPAHKIVSGLEPVGHLTLLLGQRVLEQTWTKIGRWLASSLDDAKVDVSQEKAAKAS